MRVFGKRNASGVKADVTTFDASISNCDKAGKVEEEARRMAGRFNATGLKPNVTTFSALISAYEKKITCCYMLNSPCGK